MASAATSGSTPTTPTRGNWQKRTYSHAVTPVKLPGTPEHAAVASVPATFMPKAQVPMVAPKTPPPRHHQQVETDFGSRSHIVMDGYLLKLKQTHRWIAHAKWNKRWFVLRGGFLLYFKRRGDETPAGWLRVKQVRELRTLPDNHVIPGTNRATKNCFMIGLATRRLFLRARSSQEVASWMRATVKCMEATPGTTITTTPHGGLKAVPQATPSPGAGGAGAGAGAGAGLGAKAAQTPPDAYIRPVKKASATPSDIGLDLGSPAPVMQPSPASAAYEDSGAPDIVGAVGSHRTLPHPSPAKLVVDSGGDDDGSAALPALATTSTKTPPRGLPAGLARVRRDLAKSPPKSPIHSWSGDPDCEWVEYWDEAAHSTYYVNTKTFESAWELPTTATQATAAGADATATSAPADAWVKCWDYDFNCEYYYNTATGEAQYEHPEALGDAEPEWYVDPTTGVRTPRATPGIAGTPPVAGSAAGAPSPVAGSAAGAPSPAAGVDAAAATPAGTPSAAADSKTSDADADADAGDGKEDAGGASDGKAAGSGKEDNDEDEEEDSDEDEEEDSDEESDEETTDAETTARSAAETTARTADTSAGAGAGGDGPTSGRPGLKQQPSWKDAAFGANVPLPTPIHYETGSGPMSPMVAADAAAGEPAGKVPDMQPVPAAHWVEYWDDSYGAPYYVHSVTNESVWDYPTGGDPVVHYDEGEYDYAQYYNTTDGTALPHGTYSDANVTYAQE